MRVETGMETEESYFRQLGQKDKEERKEKKRKEKKRREERRKERKRRKKKKSERPLAQEASRLRLVVVVESRSLL